MKKLVSLLCTITLLVLTACGEKKEPENKVESSTATESIVVSETEQSNKSENIEATTETSIEEISLIKICNWATSDIWNDGFCDISHFVKDGKNSVGQTMDIEFTVSNLKASMEKKSRYNDYIMSLDSSVSEQKQLQDSWVKMIEQADILYTKILEEIPRPADESYEFDTGLFNQYYSSFYKLALSIDTPTISSSIETIVATEATQITETSKTTTEEISTEAITTQQIQNVNTINSSSEIVSLIGQQIDISNTTPMFAEMIGAIEGTSFTYNDNKFEIYLFDDNSEKLIEASSGSITYTIEGFGDFSSNAIKNGNYVMIFNVYDDTVAQAFLNIQ